MGWNTEHDLGSYEVNVVILQNLALSAVLIGSLAPLSSAVRTFWDGRTHRGNDPLMRYAYGLSAAGYLLLVVTHLLAG